MEFDLTSPGLIKNDIMRKSIFVAAFMCMMLSFPSFMMTAQDMNEKSYIEVYGYAKKEVVPDEIYLSIIINETDHSKKDGIQKLEKEMTRTITSLGIDLKNLTVKDLGSDFRQYVLRRNEIRLSKEYELKTSSAQMAAKVILALETSGISNVSVSRVECSKIEDYRDEVRVEAIKEARRKAELLTGALGEVVGKPLVIVDQNYGRPYASASPVILMSKISNDADYEETFDVADIEFESLTIESNIRVKFEIL